MQWKGHAENESADRSGNSSGDIIEETDEEIAEIEVTDFEDNGPGSDHLQSAGSREDSLLRPLFAGDDSDITDSYSRDDSNDIESDDETPADSTETASVQNAEEEEADFNTPLFADSDMTLMMRQNSTETQTHLLRQLFRLRSRLLQCARPQQKRFWPRSLTIHAPNFLFSASPP